MDSEDDLSVIDMIISQKRLSLEYYRKAISSREKEVKRLEELVFQEQQSMHYWLKKRIQEKKKFVEKQTATPPLNFPNPGFSFEFGKPPGAHEKNLGQVAASFSGSARMTDWNFNPDSFFSN